VSTASFARPGKRRLALSALLLAGALASPGSAQTPAPADPTMVAPKAVGLGGVKDTLKDAMKEAVNDGSAGAAAAVAPVAGALVVPPAPLPSDPAARAMALRRKTLKDLDFVDSDESNRDPFKSFMSLFADKGTPKLRQVPAIFDKFAMEELTLIAIISGDAQPRAMFRDPSGLGQTLKRGDYVSKAGARITKILSDRVILEFTEVSGSGEPRAVEKAVLINPEEEAQK
jgi:Tfp pilus assembly protein PilP